MTLLQAIILGIVQGLTEFIPISSTAHLVFASRWTNIYNGNPEQITATIAVIQLGTLAAVFVYFAADILSISAAFVRDHWALITRKRGMRFSGTHGVRPMWVSEEAWLGWLVIIGSIPIGTVGLLFKEQIEGGATKNLWIISTMLISVAILLAFAEFVGAKKKEIKDLGIADALIVGFAQVLALMPGASRSGSTIMGGLFAGEKTRNRREIFVSAVDSSDYGERALELKEAIEILPRESFVPLLVGTIVAGIVGYISIWLLLAFLRKNSTAVFIIYRVLLGVIIIVLLWRGVISSQI